MLSSRTCGILTGFLALTPMLWAGKDYPVGPDELVVPNQLIVRLKPFANAASIITGFLPNAQIRRLNLPDVYLVNRVAGIPPGVVALLDAHGLLEFTEPNRIRQVNTVPAPNDPYYLNSM